MYGASISRWTTAYFAAGLAFLVTALALMGSGFGVPTTAFTVCTFWYINALAAVGRRDEARRIFETVLACRNHAGKLHDGHDLVL